ncbi:unnamed protein product [Rotaria sp. Silwood2]|nr:unnamed protein product [Rotaria sp. Silwood2]CAF2760145.1 unnamed protein product [Rotaria sp. Silwood2]CAF3872565.1 unnamed protein product [Rotaria sp. Silwood2]CAF4456036.1 unnamed protein product [Rotaria sp. Silwood2]
MSNSALRDIIPSNDDVSIKKTRQKQFSSVFKVLIFVLFLGFISTGIVALLLILGYSGKSIFYLIMQSSPANSLTLSNQTRTLIFHQQSSTEISGEQDLKKITLIPINHNQEIHTSSILKTKQENQHISANTQSMKFYPSSNTIVDEQLTSPIMQTTMFNRQSIILSSVTVKHEEYVETSQENKITTVDTLTSTFLMPKIRDHEMVTPEAIPLTTGIDLQSSTNQNKQKIILKKHKEVDHDDMIDDFLLI